MKTAEDVFNAAMSLMDELDGEGKATTSDTKEYEYRTPAILTALVAEKQILGGEHGGIIMIESLDDPVLNVEDNYALVVLPYGLAANLLTDENPTAASFYQQRYEELRNLFVARKAADVGTIENVYGGIEYGEFSRW